MSLSKENHKSDSLLKERKRKIYQKSLKGIISCFLRNQKRIKEMQENHLVFLIYCTCTCTAKYQRIQQNKIEAKENQKCWEIIFHTNIICFKLYFLCSFVQQHKINEIFSLGQIIK